MEICDSFLLMLSVLFFADSDGSLLLFLVAALLHEAGHYAALRLCGGQFINLRLTAAGAVMRYRMGEDAPRRCIIALAGPVVSLALAFAAAQIGEYRLAGASLLLGLFNLLPILPLDGGTVLFWLLRGVPQTAYFVSKVVALLLFAFGAALLLQGGGAALMLMGAFLLILQKNLQKS